MIGRTFLLIADLRAQLARAMLALAFLALSAPVAAQTAPPPRAPEAAPSPGLQSRIDALPAIIKGAGDFDSYFAPAFKTAVPKPQWTALNLQIAAQVGAAVKVEAITVTSPNSAMLRIGFEKGTATVLIAIDPAPPHLVIGLRITDVAPRDDSLEQIATELRALTGRAAFGVYALDGGMTSIHEIAADQAIPIGSAFKLWVLAEAGRQVKAGTRRWSDVIALGPRSLPTGVMQGWPPGSPATLHTLATLMISISDNTATDTLMAALGRDRIDQMVAASGVAEPATTLPVLTTIEALRLKAPSNRDLATKWRAAGPDGRRKLLRDNAERIAATKVDAAMFGERPLALEVEWFASARDAAHMLDGLRTASDPQALAILAVNPGASSAALFDYIGYKGGSEPGVIFGAWLVRTKQGRWYAVTGGWTRGDAKVDEARFAALMSRALTLVATR